MKERALPTCLSGACFFVISSFFIRSLASAQWINTNCIENGDISLAVSGSTVVAGTYGHGMVISTGNGNSWNHVSTSPVEPFVFFLGAHGGRFFSGTENSFFVSTDAGAGWICADTSKPAFSFLPLGDTILAGVGSGQSRSTDGGVTWTHTEWTPGNNILSLATDGQLIFAGTYFGLFVSSDRGSSWHRQAFADTSIWAAACVGGSVLVSTRTPAGNRSGGYYSTNGGLTWTRNDSVNG